MANKKTSKKSKKQKNHTLEWIIGLVISLIFGYFLGESGGFTGTFGKLAKLEELGDGKAYFHFIDVGQGDSTLITSSDKAVLIDTGSVSEAETVSKYVSRYTREIEYLILTHPHEDHMGCAAQIISEIEVKNIIMPNASSDAAFFSRFLDVAEEKEINVIEAVPGDTYQVGEMTVTVLAPLKDDYENLNNFSIVARIDVGATSALFTGDAEMEVEQALLMRYTTELDCDLFQAGHHGSSTSNSAEFVAAVAPSAAVISCGKDNSYGHPHKETVETFKKFGVEVFRTDLLGDIIFVSDGVGISKYE